MCSHFEASLNPYSSLDRTGFGCHHVSVPNHICAILNVQSSAKSLSLSDILFFQAGFDAMLTAYMFVSELAYLLKQGNSKWNSLNFVKRSKLRIPQIYPASSRLSRAPTSPVKDSVKSASIKIERLLGSAYNTVRIPNSFPSTLKFDT